MRRERKLKVDLGELNDELDSLSSFLDSKLEGKLVSMGNRLFVYSDSLSPSELKRLVNKFVYHKNLNHNFWVELEGDVVKLHKFKHSDKKEKQKDGTTPSTIKHGWQERIERVQEYALRDMLTADVLFRAKVVYLILSKDIEEALELLSNNYEVVAPKLKVGMPKRYSKNPACYVHKNRTIHVSHREILWNPNIILHEFYHHLRSVKNAQGGIEKYANTFAKNYLEAYQKITGET